MTSQQFRNLALSMPGAVEAAHMQHPDFRIGGRIFASLGYPADGWAMVRLTPEHQREAISIDPHSFQPSAGAWGRSGCTNVNLKSAAVSLVRQYLGIAAELRAADNQKPKASKKPDRSHPGKKP